MEGLHSIEDLFHSALCILWSIDRVETLLNLKDHIFEVCDRDVPIHIHFVSVHE